MADVYRFGRFVLDPQRRTLLREGSEVALGAKAFDILLFFVQNPNRVINKQELMKAVWPDTFVEEGNLTQNISLLRKALAEGGDDSRLIVTLARQGYQLTADVATGSAPNERLTTVVADAAKRYPRWRVVAVVCFAVVATVAAYVFWQGSRAEPAGTVRLAVLPFQNLTGDSTQEYLADGLTEELITHLTRAYPQQLGVIARTSVMGYKESRARLDQIGRDLSVQYVLESSVRRNADRLRVAVRLVRVRGQTPLWAHEFDYKWQDIVALEDEIAAAVGREIQLTLNPQQLAGVKRWRRVDPGAFDAYLQGRWFAQRAGNDNLDSATTYYEAAIKRDSGYALAWVWLSDARRRATYRHLVPSVEGIRRTHDAIERALAIDPNLADAHAQLAWIRMLVDWDWAGADASLKRAIELDPGNPDIVSKASVLAGVLGRFEEAVELAQRACELDPLNPQAFSTLGQLYYDMGRQEKAAATTKRSMELFNLPYTPELLALVYLAQGNADSALVTLERETSDLLQVQGRALVYHALGRKSASDSALAQLIARYETRMAYHIAQVYSFRGESDRAFEWLERAFAQREQGLAGVKRDRLLQNLHRDPRYAAILTKLRLPP